VDPIDRFREALRVGGYRDQTGRRYATALRAMRTDALYDLDFTLVNVSAARAWQRWRESHTDPVLTRNVGIFLAEHENQKATEKTGIEKRREAQTRRKLAARSIPDAEWQHLYDVLLEDSMKRGGAIPAVLLTLMATGLRIGDLLAIPCSALLEAKRTNQVRFDAKGGEWRILPIAGAPADWLRLIALAERNRDATNVAQLVTPKDTRASGEGPAYKRVRRALLRAAGRAGVDGRIYLHRLRRTVAVQALRVTEDMPAVQQLLGHRSMLTTSTYLDEARPDAIGNVQRRIREKFGREELPGKGS